MILLHYNGLTYSCSMETQFMHRSILMFWYLQQQSTLNALLRSSEILLGCFPHCYHTDILPRRLWSYYPSWHHKMGVDISTWRATIEHFHLSSRTHRTRNARKPLKVDYWLFIVPGITWLVLTFCFAPVSFQQHKA